MFVIIAVVIVIIYYLTSDLSLAILLVLRPAAGADFQKTLLEKAACLNKTLLKNNKHQ